MATWRRAALEQARVGAGSQEQRPAGAAQDRQSTAALEQPSRRGGVGAREERPAGAAQDRQATAALELGHGSSGRRAEAAQDRQATATHAEKGEACGCGLCACTVCFFLREPMRCVVWCVLCPWWLGLDGRCVRGQVSVRV